MKIQRKDEWGKKFQVWVSRDGINCEILFVDKDTSDKDILIQAEALFSSKDIEAQKLADKTIADNLLTEKLDLVKDVAIVDLKTMLGVKGGITYTD